MRSEKPVSRSMSTTLPARSPFPLSDRPAAGAGSCSSQNLAADLARAEVLVAALVEELVVALAGAPGVDSVVEPEVDLVVEPEVGSVKVAACIHGRLELLGGRKRVMAEGLHTWVRSGSQSMLPALRVVSGSTSSLIGLFFSKPLAAPPAFFLRAKLPGRF